MNREGLINEIARIQYFVKVMVYKVISDKEEYFKRIRDTYKDMSIDEILENLDIVRYAAVGAINLKNEEYINDIYSVRKSMEYEKYLNRLNELQKELESELSKIKKININELDSYIEDNL